MKKRSLIKAALTIGLLLCVTGLLEISFGQDASGGASGAKITGLAQYIGPDKCLTCHAKMRDLWSKNPHAGTTSAVSDPALQGCEACHGPGSLHMGSGGEKAHITRPAEVDKSALSNLCMKCHGSRESIVPQSWKKLDAQAWRNSGHYRKGILCGKCHAVHADTGKLLTESPEKLCKTCHASLADAGGGAYVHSPVKQMKCLTCHDPHGTDQLPHMVRKNISTICGDCHKTGNPDIKTGHAGMDVSGSQCTDCHDPHLKTPGAGMLRPSEHQPFKSRKCETCHAGEPGAVSSKLKKDAKALCTGCHGQTMQKITDAPDKHFPAAEKMCTKCHSPHVSSRKTMMRDSYEAICTTCHKKVDDQLSGMVQHPPVATGNCLTCHIPHGGDFEKLLVQEPNSLCSKCHSKFKFSHPLHEQDKNPEFGPIIRCYSCHAVHGSDIPKLLPYVETTLCNKCHAKNAARPVDPEESGNE